MATNWTIRGLYMEACTCDAICPCITLSDPTEGTCSAVIGWHIEEGRSADVDLSGLNVALALYSPGNMSAGNMTGELLLDERASESQRDALTAIWGGQAGGHLGQIAQLFGEIVGVKAVPIEFESDGRRKGRLKVGELGEAAWEAIDTPDGNPVTVSHHPLAIAPGHDAIVGRASRARFDDLGISFDVQGRQAMTSPFDYSGAAS